MSARTARTHNHVSNRAKPREAGERKVLYKSVLDNPFRICWPFVPMNIQNSILSLSLVMMEGLSNYHLSRGKIGCKRKRGQKAPPQKKRRIDNEAGSSSMDTALDGDTFGPSNAIPPSSSKTETSALAPPEILQHLTVGINEVTKRLESQIHHSRVTVVTTAESPKIALPCLKLILVCRADIDPPLIVDHLPHLVAAYNSIATTDIVKLIPLEKGAESSLAQVIGLRRASVVGFDVACPELGTLMALADNVPILTATWLASVPRSQLIPTHIKQVRTSAPKDMKAAKEKRLEGKAFAKQHRKDTNQSSLNTKRKDTILS